MKGSRIFTICIILFLVIMFIVEYNLPKNFVWKPTFSQYDEQPFGCAIFDDVVAASYPDGYSISGQSFYQITEDSVQELNSYLLVEEKLNLIDVDVNSLLDLAAAGNRIMLVSTSFGKAMRDTLGVSTSYGYFSANELKKYASNFFGRDTLVWVDDSVYNMNLYTFYPQICRTNFMNTDSLANILALKKKDYGQLDYAELFTEDVNQVEEDEAKKELYDNVVMALSEQKVSAVAYSRNIGKGKIVFVSTPLIFTNYGMLDGNNSEYIFRLLNELKGLPLKRLEGYGVKYTNDSTPLRYFLSNPPLRWGLYLSLLTVLLFMIFTARRRQRVIPIVRDPENKTVEFTELIGTLYFQRKNHTDLLQKKFTYFAETLRRSIQVDVENEDDDEALSRRISSKTGLEEEKIMQMFRRVRPVINDESTINEEQLKTCIDSINEIINHL